MSYINDNAKELLGTAKAVAVRVLGGEIGTDYGSWADDIAQDVIVNLLETEENKGFESKYHAFAQCHLVAKQKSISFKKGEQRRREIEQEHGNKINSTLTGQSAELLAADPYEILAYEEMRERLDELSPLLHATTELHYIQGLPIAEIARMQDVTEDVVYKRLQRAREFIRDEQPDDIKTESTRPSMEDIEQQQRDNFARRDKAFVMRHRRLYG